MPFTPRLQHTSTSSDKGKSWAYRTVELLAKCKAYFEEMDISATAKVMGIPEGTVKSRLSKARKLLKEVLGRESDLQF